MAAPMTSKMNGGATVLTLTSGTAQTLSAKGLPLPATVWTRPVAGDTVTISYSTDNGANYQTWPSGAVTSYTEDVLDSGVTHIKFQRTAGAGVTSTCGVC